MTDRAPLAPAPARLALVACLALGTSACAQNAVLDLDVELPAAGEMVDAAAIGAVTVQLDVGTEDFESDWAAGVAHHSVELGAAPQTLRLSVLAQPAQITQSLAVRVLYCDTLAACEGTPPSPRVERRVLFPRAFYQGVVTRYRLDASAPPPSTSPFPDEIDPCDVAGCRDGEMATWCVGGVHLCER